MKKLALSLFACIMILTSANAKKFNFDSYQLENGLTVILNEDHTQSKVFGTVAVNAGAANEPEDATGLAHYLEHVLFNGTSNLGTVDWEAEKVHYDKVVGLFEELRLTEDEDKQEQIIKAINEESIAQSNYFQTKEFVLLLESLGAQGINAGTGYDFTYYLSEFPESQSANWLAIYANEFKDPVFRNFQAELETVYEEYNMGAENPFRNLMQVSFDHMWEGSPYGKSIVGHSEHLKRPSLKKLIEFYEKWYVPGNMALILVGDFDSETIKPQIESTFGQLEAKPVPQMEENHYSLEKRDKLKLKETPYTIGRWCFNAPTIKDEDIVKMQLLDEVLSNSASIGVLDQLQTDGDVISVSSFYFPFKNAGMIGVQAIPNFDIAQMRQLSTSEIDELIFDKIEAVKSGEAIDEKLLEAVRDNYIRDLMVSLENYSFRATWLIDFIFSGRDVNDANQYIERIGAITVDDIVAVANQYLNDTYLEISSTRGDIKLEEIEKPSIEPVLQKVEAPSVFAQKMEEKISSVEADPAYIDFEKDIKRVTIADKVELFYKQNKQNDIFDLRIVYNVGTETIPTLGFAAQLMNNAGVRGNYEPHEFKKRMGEIGCSYNFSASDNSLVVHINGREKNMQEACRLISMVTLMPKLDIKQYNSLIGNEMRERETQKSNFQNLSNAGLLYLVYGEQSPNIDRLSWNELSEVSINSLTGDFIKATKYEASVHYYGVDQFEQAKEKILTSLAFAAGRKAAPEYFVRPFRDVDENTVYFVNKPGTRQCNVYVMVPVTQQYQLEQAEEVEVFSKYFGEGLVNIFFSEIREYRSMGYNAGASIVTPSLQGKPACLYGSVSTQGDKTNDVVEVVIDLIKEMPQKERKAEVVRNNLMYGSPLNRPADRYLSYNIESWERLGYTEDPVKVHQPEFANVDMAYINNFYAQNIQEKPWSIMIVGDKRNIDKKLMKQLGEYEFVSSSKLFSE